MKELTYEDWVKKPQPRNMWVWDSSESNKKQRKVIYFLDPKLTYPIVALSDDGTITANFKHCAEIEKPRTRRMTNKELSRWLREKPTREYKYQTSDYICVAFDYTECRQDKEAHVDIRIRENYGEWREPLVEVTDD